MGVSFNNDPFKNVSVHKKDGEFLWACDSCGATSTITWIPIDTMDELWSDWYAHVRRSHGLSPADTHDRSCY